jgi:hypothetical protein
MLFTIFSCILHWPNVVNHNLLVMMVKRCKCLLVIELLLSKERECIISYFDYNGVFFNFSADHYYWFGQNVRTRKYGKIARKCLLIAVPLRKHAPDMISNPIRGCYIFKKQSQSKYCFRFICTRWARRRDGRIIMGCTRSN